MKLAELADGYRSLFASAVISPRRIGEVDGIITRIVMHKDIYAGVEAEAGTPWFVVGLLHNLECDLNFGQHLHNGDSLAHPTFNDPAHRPPGWMEMPAAMRTWDRSALDSLQYDHLNFRDGWDVPRLCFEFETFNGFGYHAHNVPSPYLWAGCQHYVKGKYVADHDFDPNAVSDQIGTAVILKRMLERNIVALKAEAA